MAFKLKHFVAGAAKEATRLQDERRKQAMETIQNSLALQGRDRLEKKTLRDKEIQQLAVTAKELSNLGLEDDQIKLVLSQGVDRASEIAGGVTNGCSKETCRSKRVLGITGRRRSWQALCGRIYTAWTDCWKNRSRFIQQSYRHA